jgi:hypothetical protein
MKINGKFSGYARQLLVKRNEDTDGQTAQVDFVTRVTEQQCETAFGDKFSIVAFGGMAIVDSSDDESKVNEDLSDSVQHLIKKPQPSKSLVVEMHSCSLCGVTIPGAVQPELKIEPVDGKRKVDVVIRVAVPLYISDELDAKTFGLFRTGTYAAIEFSPKQLNLPLG